jgi:hypothetical protein
MPYKIEQFGKKYKVCKKDGEKCFSNYPLPYEVAHSQLVAILTNEYESKFEKQLKEYDLTLKSYLELAKLVASHRGYDPNKLRICHDGKHKLMYDNTKFGAVGYKDNIIYNWLEYNGKIPKGTAEKKRINYRKRAFKIMSESNNLSSSSSLSYYILW